MKFTWDLIHQNMSKFNIDYNYEDARVLLQLSLMVTNANFDEKALDTPEWLQDIPLIYDICPLFVPLQRKRDKSKQTPEHMDKFNVRDEIKPLMGHILYNEQINILFIVFTGTSNICLAGLDLEYGQTELNDLLNYTPGIRGHRGVYTAYQSVRPQLVEVFQKYLYKNPQIVITGHSLGGALSQMCALDLAFYDPIHYSFAAPLMFNPLGCQAYEKFVKYSYRVANLSDLVVISPLPIMPNKDMFCHVGKLIHFQRNLGEYPLNHSLAYVQEYNLSY